MSRVLLVDDSPHAQRMGERILSEEGFEVVTVSNADSALIRMEDVDPDVVLADTVMPGRTGYDICQYLKMSPRHRHVRVILTAGVLEAMDDALAQKVQADASLRKPFEASALVSAVRPLAEAATAARAEAGMSAGRTAGSAARPAHAVPFVAVVDAEQVRAAVTIALDASMGAMVDEITQRVLAALNTNKPEAAEPAARPELEPPRSAPVRLATALPAAVKPAAPLAPPSISRVEPVRRVNTVKMRSGSMLRLDLNRPEPEEPSSPAPDSGSPADE
jgi:CheY-like chemotaxis protein